MAAPTALRTMVDPHQASLGRRNRDCWRGKNLALNDRTGSINPKSPSSLLEFGVERPAAREPDATLPQLGPSSLLGSDVEGPAAPDPGVTLPQLGPSSLLGSAVERPAALDPSAIWPQRSPSSLLEPSPESQGSDSLAAHSRAIDDYGFLARSVRRHGLSTNGRIKAGAGVAAFILLAVVVMLLVRAGIQPTQDPEVLLAEGMELQRKGDLRAAIIAFRNLVQQRLEDPQARYLLGSAHHANGEFAQAERDFRRALELGFDPDKGVVALARSLLLQGQFQKVLDELPPVPDSVGAHAVEVNSIRGLAYLGVGKAKDAEILFKRALEADPSAIDATLGMARIAAAQDRHADAERLIDQAMQVDARSLDALLMKAELNTALNRADQARAAFRRVLEVYPANPQAHVSLAWMAIQAGEQAAAEYHVAIARKAAPDSPQTNYIHALLEFRRKNISSAKIAVDRALRSSPGDVPSLLLAGAIAYAEERYMDAQQLLLRGLTRLPTHVGGRKLYGATLLKLGQPSGALDVLLATLQIAPKDGELYILVGQAYMQAGDYAGASQYLDKASELRPRDFQAQFALGLSHMIAGQLNQALAALESGLRSDAAPAELDALRVAAYVKRGDIARAEQAWAAVHRKQPNAASTLQLRAAILSAKKDLAGARTALEQALMLEPTFVPAAIGLAKLDLDEDDPLNARQRLERILRVDPRNAEAMLALAEMGPAIKATTAEIKGWLKDAQKLNPKSARASFLLARLLLQSGNPQEALAIARESAKAHPEHPGILDVLGSAQRAVGDSTGAIGTFSSLTILMPNSVEAMYKLAGVQAETGSNAAAAVTLHRLLSRVPDHPSALAMLARLNIHSGRPGEAIVLARKLQERKETAATGHLLEGDATRTADPLHAVESYETALRLEPSAEGIIGLHEGLTNLGRTSEADERLRRWVDARPDDWDARLQWADVMLTRKEYAQAKTHYLAALAQFPENPKILNNLAIAMTRTQDPRALEHAQRANSLRPNDSAILDTLGWIHLRRGELDVAIELLRRSVSLRPDYWEPRLHLAEAYAKSKDYAKARSELEHGLKMHPPTDRALEFEHALRQLPL